MQLNNANKIAKAAVFSISRSLSLHDNPLVLLLIDLLDARTVARSSSGGGETLLVEFGEYGRNDTLQVGEPLLVDGSVALSVAVEPVEVLVDELVELSAIGVDEHGGVLLDGGAHAEQVALEHVARDHAPLELLVLFLEALRLGDHLLDLELVQAALLVLDLDVLALAGALLARHHAQYAVGVHVERDLDARYAARRCRQAHELELAEQVVVLGHRALALEHLHGHARLVVLVRGEVLLDRARYARVAIDQLVHHAADRLQSQRERNHVHEQHVLDDLARVARQYGSLACVCLLVRLGQHSVQYTKQQ